ncbi:MAG: hypothetical protein IPO22_03975 [Anaerolineales bacterium]|nr:hypothetical protein [Anaerolineales bacterium]
MEGNQSDISDLIKPITGDRNVNPEELRCYVRTQVGWLNPNTALAEPLKHSGGCSLHLTPSSLKASHPQTSRMHCIHR